MDKAKTELKKKILLTGATGYIGKRMINVLVDNGYFVVACTRDLSRLKIPEGLDHSSVQIIEADFLDLPQIQENIPKDISGAYYLMHSMSASKNYKKIEKEVAQNFVKAVNNTSCEHVIYLTGIVNEEETSEHLESRKMVENTLAEGNYNFTALRAGIIIGSGSASFEIIRDLIEKLPVMLTPKWVNTKCQPISISNVLDFLVLSLFKEKTYNQNFDIGCDEIVSYKEMLLTYADVRNLNRKIYTVPLMTPKFSSYWLYFITSTSYTLASSLVDSMTVEVVCRPDKLNEIKEITGVKTIIYRESLERTLAKIQANEIVSSWKDSFVSSRDDDTLTEYLSVPEHGVYNDRREVEYDSKESCINRVFSIGGENGWYGQRLWKIRGVMDQFLGGPGLKRGRRDPNIIFIGDAIDFWRVLYADRNEGKLILFAEMKLPGEAWLSFEVKDGTLTQEAVFRPKGLWGRLYWYSVLPFHGYIFKGMARYLATGHR